jgi:non-ribosomal peptide synthetase component E (peptide arylation enzyme)
VLKIPVPILAGAAGASALAAYLNAKLHLAHDYKNARGGLAPPPDVVELLTDRVARKRVLNYHVFEDQALHNIPDQPFLIFEGKTWTYKEFFDCIIRVSNWLMNDLGIGVEEVVAINGGNSPEYFMLWFALDGIGAVPSFVNWQLTGAGLVHCAKVGDSYMIVNSYEALMLHSYVVRDISLQMSMSRATLSPAVTNLRTQASRSHITTHPFWHHYPIPLRYPLLAMKIST